MKGMYSFNQFLVNTADRTPRLAALKASVSADDRFQLQPRSHVKAALVR